MLKKFMPHLMLVLAMTFAASAFAAAEPTVHQVFEAAHTGHMKEAQQMMNQVLRDHPTSAKAHYVAAELNAEAGNAALARQELKTARKLEPGLPFANAASVRELEGKLAQAQPAQGFAARSLGSQFPWGAVLLVGAGVVVVWFVIRRRSAPAAYSSYQSSVPAGAGPGNPGGAGVAPNVGGGMGSGIASGLASGLAVGAGVVAGEEIARHFLEPDRHEGNAPPAANEPVNNPPPDDLGGSDFGISDGSSWDDDSGGIGGGSGGDDWT